MLLLIRHRYPNLAVALGFVAALGFIALGVVHHHSTFVVSGIASIALSFVGMHRRRRSSNPAVR